MCPLNCPALRQGNDIIIHSTSPPVSPVCVLLQTRGMALGGASLFGLEKFLKKNLADTHQLPKLTAAGGKSASVLRKGSVSQTIAST